MIGIHFFLNNLAILDVKSFDESSRLKLYFYFVSTFLGALTMMGFGLVLAAKGNILIPITDFVNSAVLVFTFLYLKYTKNLHRACIIAAIAFITFLLVHLITGGTDKAGLFWYFLFPPLALYLLGSRLGMLLSLINAIPIFVVLITISTGFAIAEYTSPFIIRFFIAYLVSERKLKTPYFTRLLWTKAV
jgi:hypothetical protein